MAGDKKTVVKPFRMTEKEAEKLRLDAEQKGIRIYPTAIVAEAE